MTETDVSEESPTSPPTAEDPNAPTRREVVGAKRRQMRRRRVSEWIVVLVLAAAIAVGLRLFVVQTFYVPSGSMRPTLQVGDRILVDKIPGLARSVHRGDIIVFRRVPRDTDPTHPADLVKRVIGLPGETISSRGDTVLINGVPLKEPWLPDLAGQPPSYECYQSAYDIPKTKIPAGHYFVMGDCRGNSYDSRDWGTVPSGNIIGRVFLTIWHDNHPWFTWF